MSTETSDQNHSTAVTVTLLESRLRRLEFLVTGSSTTDGITESAVQVAENGAAASQSLKKIEGNLNRLRKLEGVSGMLVREIESIQSHFPEVFAGTAEAKPAELSTLASIVLSHATLYPETASRLASLQSLQIPPAELSAKLADLSPRIATYGQRQAEMDQQIKHLRERSAKCLEWWVRIGVVGTNELWEDMADRITVLERQLTHMERRARENDGYI